MMMTWAWQRKEECYRVCFARDAELPAKKEHAQMTV
jgi:hypothetical protein